MTQYRPGTRPSRRSLIRSAAAAAIATGLAAARPFAAAAADAAAKPKRILLRNGWQVINIGDIGHTPGGLHLLEQHLPDAQVTLWLASTTDAVSAMLRARFPRVRVVMGTIDKTTLAVTGDELKQALAEADLCVHGSGPSVTTPELLGWCQANRKPFGVLGVTLGDLDQKQVALLSNARFLFTRDTLSLAAARKAGVKGPAMGFAPDSTFAIDVRDDAKGMAFLKSAGLEPGTFVCAVPRLRYTPYKSFPPAEIERRAAESERFAEPDHAKLRAAIEAVVRKTDKSVLVCPEMTYALDVMDKLLVDPLPADVRRRVVKRATFWLPDEAASVYARAAAVVSLEMHSPIIALANGTPGVYLRQPTDTRKGQMMRDLGLPEWIHEVDDATGEQVAATTLGILADPPAAKAKVARAMATVAERHAEAFGVIRQALG